MKKLFLAMLVCAGLCACTNDDVVVGSVDAQKAFEGDVAYMTVRIKDVNTGTRATDGGYKTGTAAEYAVENAYFYFYDDAGVFVSEAEVWDGGTATQEGDDDYPNVEFEGNTVIVLKGLTGTGYPNCVVTVLNRPEQFTPGNTLEEMAAKLADASDVGIYLGTTPENQGSLPTDFVMSTSSYVADSPFTVGGTNGTPYYFVTPVTEENFYEEPISTDIEHPVDIYVERLAAKVGTDVDSDLADTATDLGDGKVGYKLTETIAGDQNHEESGSGEGDEDVYVVIEGWALNGTAKHSNMVKDITGFSTTDGIDGWTGWNVPTDYRSYWGKSFNYGLGFGQYPTTSEGASGSEGEGKTLNTWLDYVSYSDLTYGMGDSEYCAENTNTAGGSTENGVIQTKNTSAITNALIAATVCDVQGEPLDLVRYQGVLFTKVHYLDYVLDELNSLGQLDVYTRTVSQVGDETITTYTQIDGSYVELAKTDGNVTYTDGYVVVVPIEEMFEDVTFYTKEGVEIDDAYATVLTALQAFNANHDKVNAYTGGAMYYSVPIEHLNNNVGTADSDGNVIPLEANYGIVRNHWYNLTITSIANLGKGVFDPDEVIIPNIDDEKYYYVGADINILSWKLVNQNVDL